MLEVQTYLDNGLPVLYAHLNQTKNGFTMADRFKDDKIKQDYTFYSMNKKTDKKTTITAKEEIKLKEIKNKKTGWWQK